MKIPVHSTLKGINMSGVIILADGTEYTIDAPQEVKIEGDDIYVDGEVISVPQHKRIVVVIGNIGKVSCSKMDIGMFFGTVDQILLTTGSVTVNGTVNGPIRDNGGPVTVNGKNRKKLK